MIKLVLSEAIDLLRSIDENSVKAIIQDPPYSSKSNPSMYTSYNDKNMKADFTYDYWKEFLKEAKRILRDDGFIATTMDYRTIHRFLMPAEELGFHIRRMIVFQIGIVTEGCCRNDVLVTNTILNPILSKKEKTKMYPERLRKYFGEEQVTSLWLIPKRNGNIRFSGGQPIEPYLMLVELLTNEGDLVVDPFCGSGTTGEACLILGRKFIGGDIDEDNLMKARIRLSGYEE